MVTDRVKPKLIGAPTVPAYPPLARLARVRGPVEMDVSIDAAGQVAHLRVVSGHALLIPASIDAVKQWRFEPSTDPPANVQVIFTFGSVIE